MQGCPFILLLVVGIHRGKTIPGLWFYELQIGFVRFFTFLANASFAASFLSFIARARMALLSSS